MPQVLAPQVLAPGVVRVATGGSRGINAFLIADGGRDIRDAEGFTLVDVGWPAAANTVAAAVERIGRAVTDIRRIVLTHAHPDHVGGVSALRERSGARVFMHARDVPWARAGRVPPEGRSGLLGRLLDRLPALHWTPFEPDDLLADGQIVPGSGGLRAVHTPGHTAGHLVFVHEPTGVVLVGDSIVHRGGRLSLGPAALAQFPEDRSVGLARLPVDVTAVGFAHGLPLDRDHLKPYARLVGAAG